MSRIFLIIFICFLNSKIEGSQLCVFSMANDTGYFEPRTKNPFDKHGLKISWVQKIRSILERSSRYGFGSIYLKYRRTGLIHWDCSIIQNPPNQNRISRYFRSCFDQTHSATVGLRLVRTNLGEKP